MTWYLLLAHFIADYPLQPNWMARNKRKPHVMFGHISIHFLVMLLLAGEARRAVWPFLLALAMTHLVIDIGKETVHWLRPAWVIGPYVIDQLFHYLTIFLTGAWIAGQAGQVELPFTPEVAILAATYLAGTYVWFISERIFAHADESYRGEVQTQLWPRMATRAVMLSVMLWILIWSGGWIVDLAFGQIRFTTSMANFTTRVPILFGVAAAVPYINGKHRQRALLTDILVSLALTLLAGLALWSQIQSGR
jgi:hypothetical protein